MTSLTAHGICNAIGGKLVSGPFDLSLIHI